MTEFAYSDMLPVGPDTTEYRLLTTEGVSTFEADGHTFLRVDPEAIRHLTSEAMKDISHYLRTEHLQQLRNIIDDPEASANDVFVATELLLNANIAAAGVLPMCQDTGTAVVMGKKGDQVVTYGDEQGGYPHPDHIKVHDISVPAFERAGSSEWYPDAGEPFAPSKLYYSIWAKARALAYHEKMIEEGWDISIIGEEDFFALVNQADGSDSAS